MSDAFYFLSSRYEEERLKARRERSVQRGRLIGAESGLGLGGAHSWGAAGGFCSAGTDDIHTYGRVEGFESDEGSNPVSPTESQSDIRRVKSSVTVRNQDRGTHLAKMVARSNHDKIKLSLDRGDRSSNLTPTDLEMPLH